MILAAYRSGLYNLLYLGHIVTIVIAFAPAVINPILGAQVRSDGEDTARRVSAHMATNGARVHFPALVLSAAFGLGLVIESDPLYGFDQAWVSLAFLVWLALCGVVTGIILPAERRLAAGDAAAERLVGRGGGIATVLLLVMLYLMIWKPGV